MINRSNLFLVAILCFWGSTIVGAQDQVPAPFHKEGDTWQFTVSRKGQITSTTAERADGIYELTVSPDKKIKIYEVGDSGKTESDIPRAGFLRNLVSISKDRPDLKFPLSVGEKWSYDYTFRPPGARQDQKRSVEINVTGIETVTTPAGAFDAYKLVKKESWSFTTRPGGGNQRGSTTTYFFSPQTKSIIKRSTASDDDAGTIETELTKFTPGS